MMHIAEYDDVDPLQVLHLNLLCLDFALTPELVRLIRRMDPRPFPFFALYAVEGNAVVGQVGVFRLPVVSSAGAAEVGGVWAVSTHPAWRGRGVASLLLDEAHARMAAAGLRFSTLGTNASGVAHRLYIKLGYHDLHSPAVALGRSDALPRLPALRAEPAGVERLALADRLFEQIACGQLGFARRHTPFFAFLHARSHLDADDLWLLWQGDALVGYAAVSAGNDLLRVRNLLLADGIDRPAAAVTLAQATHTRYVHIRLDRPGATFARAGFHLTPRSWATFMVKPLAADATPADFRQLYGLEDGRFLISDLDVT
ncbi:MAG TPA: GNAT family N-acetyltransferase [Chloroflexi bacterium]|nr:GNAT family N-acetyltransferase [Chloroflexota bacterium]